MRNVVFASLLLAAALRVSVVTAQPPNCGRQIDAIVSTQWLADHAAEVMIIDVRSPAEYAENHIPGSSNAPTEQWWVIRDELLLELPDDDALRTLIGGAGISHTTKVVLAGETITAFGRANPSRVAFTLIYGGVKNVALLDGGYTAWAAEERPVTNETFVPPAVVYNGSIQKRITADKNYVKYFLRSATIVDARVTEDFFGVSPLEFSEKEGHITGATSLPTPWLFVSDGKFRTADDLRAMARGVIDGGPFQRIIVYCGVGGYASTTWFILSELLGYQKVKMYDGSIQEWTKDPDAPVTKYSW